MEPLDVPFPIKGLHEGQPYSQQPPGTTPDCRNVRAFSPTTDRNCGASRAGMTQFYSGTINGANPIVEGLSVTKIDSRVTYTTRTSVDANSVVARKVLPSRLDALAMAIDRQSNLYIAGARSTGSGLNTLIKLNAGLVEQWVVPLPMQRSSDVLKSVRLDEEESIYCVISTGAAAAASGPTRVYKFREYDDPGPVITEWYLDAPQGGWFTDIAVKNGVMYAVEDTFAAGVFLHRYDEANTARPVLTWSCMIRATAGEQCYAVAIADDGAAICAIVDDTNPPNANGKLEKFGPMAPDVTTPATTTDPGSAERWQYNNQGVGQAIVNKGGYLYSQGYASGGSVLCVRRLVDNGDTVTSSASVTLDAFTEFKGAQSLDVDNQGNVYVTTFSSSTDTVVTKISAAFSNVWELTGDHLATADLNAFCVVVDPKPADDGGGNEQAEYIYVGTGADSVTFEAVHKVSLVTIATADGSPRTTQNVVVTNGTIRIVTSSAVTTPSGSPTLSSTARWVQAAAALNHVYFTDGLIYRDLDLIAGSVSDWAPTAGEIPRRGRLLDIAFLGALVAGFENNPHQWALSALGDLYNWDFFPPDQTVTQAILGSNSNAGLCPDIITSIIRASDDLVFFGGDKSIHRLTGDPRSDGRFDLISDETGVAWGRAWCKDPAGTIYFVGQQGGFYVMSSSGNPLKFSVESLSDRFRDLDTGLNKIQLVWNDKEEGVHVFITPYSAGSTVHYFWDTRNNAWWPDSFGATDLDPMAVWVYDGDAAGDRVILLGGRDGKIRKWSESTKNDDGTAISSYVVIPILGDLSSEFRLSNWRAVLASYSDTVTFETFGLEQADSQSPGSAVSTTTFTAGRNSNFRDKTRGNVVLAKISNSNSARAWAMESLACDREPAGRARNR